jgi:pimeloyl-ACP methyl ester carboxylesterase
MDKRFYLVLICLSLTGCLTDWNGAKAQHSATRFEVELDSLTLFDQARNRSIPVAIYQPKKLKRAKNKGVIIFSHGYGENKGGDNLIYSYLTENLAANGYFVASIQHELPTDSLIPAKGIPQIVRRPFWDRGADNILYVIQALKRSDPELNFKNLTLIGHSNGGDMTALFPQKYPDIASRIITLDNRRMALPRTSHPKVYSLRSSDFPADEGVLPSLADQGRYQMKIIKLSNTRHGEMDNNASAEQRREINHYVLRFLRD